MDVSALLMLVVLACFVLAALSVPRANRPPVGLAFLALGHVWSSIIVSIR